MIGRVSVFLTEAAGALPSRTVVVLEAIKRAILAGELTPGQQLVETDLAEKLGVSKTPVREALKTLAGAGMVTMSPYKGATVRRVTSDDARHLYDVRLILEPEALVRSIAAGHDWTQAAAALTRADITADLVERNLANRDFHDALYQGCGNPLLLSILADLRDQTALVSAAFWRRNPSWECEAAEHHAILRAAQASQPGPAGDLLRAHISASIQRNFPPQPLEASS
jgi:DNA-binding GntR family transcriptional regulator